MDKGARDYQIGKKIWQSENWKEGAKVEVRFQVAVFAFTRIGNSKL